MRRATAQAIGPVLQPRNGDAQEQLLCIKSQNLVHALRRACEANSSHNIMTQTPSDNDSSVVDIGDSATRCALDIACTVKLVKTLA